MEAGFWPGRVPAGFTKQTAAKVFKTSGRWVIGSACDAEKWVQGERCEESTQPLNCACLRSHTLKMANLCSGGVPQVVWNRQQALRSEVVKFAARGSSPKRISCLAIDLSAVASTTTTSFALRLAFLTGNPSDRPKPLAMRGFQMSASSRQITTTRSSAGRRWNHCGTARCTVRPILPSHSNHTSHILGTFHAADHITARLHFITSRTYAFCTIIKDPECGLHSLTCIIRSSRIDCLR